MRVVFNFPGEFGYFTDIYEYCTILRSKGIEVHYIGVGPADTITEHVVEGVRVTTIPSGAGFRNVLKKMAEITDSLKPDIVHNFNFRGCFVLPLLSRYRKARWIVDVRSRYAGNIRGKSRFHMLRNRITWIETFPYHNILVIAEPLRRMLFPSLRPVDLIPLGASKRRFCSGDKPDIRKAIRNEYNIPEHAPLMLYAGVVHPKRKTGDLIDAFYLVRKKIPDIYFLFVGGGDNPKFLEDLRKKADDYGLNGSVFFTGRVPYYDVQKYYFVSDIGLSYTPAGTPFELQPSTKLIEYMMSGLISVSNKTKMAEVYVKDNINGILCGDGADGLASGMMRAIAVLENPDTMIRNAREAVEEYDWERIVADRLLPYYKRILTKDN
jgi:glycosyltransferase involved in cell wall biosynthesis